MGTTERGTFSSLLQTIRQAVWTVCVGVVSGLALYLGLCVLALAVYGSVFPPITGVQLQRHVEALWNQTLPNRHYHPVPLNRMAPSLPRAVVAAEDSRFFAHHGIDWSMVREAISEYRTDGDLRGASTLSQQLVKNLFLTTHSTYLRKALEVPLTYAAELLLSKERILELYLNVVEWGPGVYGADAAAQHYYGQAAHTLTRAQSAALAACLPNPLVRRPQAVGWYQRIILRRMSNLGSLPFSSPRPATATDSSPAPGEGAPDADPLDRSPSDSTPTDELQLSPVAPVSEDTLRSGDSTAVSTPDSLTHP